MAEIKEFVLKDRKTILMDVFLQADDALIKQEHIRKGDHFISDHWKDATLGLPVLMEIRNIGYNHIFMKGGGGIHIDLCYVLAERVKYQ